jgi:hypothetical protein
VSISIETRTKHLHQINAVPNLSSRFDNSWGCIGKLPSYLASLGYKNPDQPDNTLSHYATGTDFFAYLRNDPVRLARFNSAMKGSSLLTASPVPSSLLEPDPTLSDENAVAMVDVGGGVGQVTEKVMEANPQLQGRRFILQDLGPIVEQARAKDPKYQVMEYDFFTPQPVHGRFSLLQQPQALLCYPPNPIPSRPYRPYPYPPIP